MMRNYVAQYDTSRDLIIMKYPSLKILRDVYAMRYVDRPFLYIHIRIYIG